MANEPKVSPPQPSPTVPPVRTSPVDKAAPGTAPVKTSFLTYLLLGKSKPGEIIVYHHSTLFYWWPVWALGFLMALISFVGDTMAIVPEGTHTATVTQGSALVDGKVETVKDRDVLLLPENKKHILVKDSTGQMHPLEPTIYMTRHKNVGRIFLFVLLLVIAITNVHMRGLWSFFVLLVLVMLAIIFAVAGLWDQIFAGAGRLAIYINLGAYVFLSLVLFVLWLVNFLIFDRQTYMIFTPGQVRMRLEIGGGETVYDTTGMVVQKYRSDLFRHWILGFGSGDLVVRPSGVAHPIEMPNVLNVGRKVSLIEDMVKEKVVLTQK
jgi:hypothetical protein